MRTAGLFATGEPRGGMERFFLDPVAHERPLSVVLVVPSKHPQAASDEPNYSQCTQTQPLQLEPPTVKNTFPFRFLLACINHTRDKVS